MNTTSSGDLIADRRFLYAEDALRDGDGIAARDLYLQTLERVSGWLPARFGLARALVLLGERQAAETAFRDILSEDARDLFGAGAWLARLTGSSALEGALSDAYIARLFDDYATRFDGHLVDALGYHAPQLLAAALAECDGERHFETLVDLGCGTGLMPMAIPGRYTRALGIDLSQAMLDQAERKRLYDRLLCADLLTAMRAERGQSADLIIAADVFCYVDPLEPVLKAAHHLLGSGGMMAFTIQTHEGRGAMIGGDLRVHHSADDVADMARSIGFRLCLLRHESSRMDAGKPVEGATFVLERD